MNQTNNKATAAVPVAALKKAADNIRILSVSMVEKAKSGHPGGAMGGADFVSVLYGCFLRYNPDNMTYPWRDRMFNKMRLYSISKTPKIIIILLL